MSVVTSSGKPLVPSTQPPLDSSDLSEASAAPLDAGSLLPAKIEIDFLSEIDFLPGEARERVFNAIKQNNRLYSQIKQNNRLYSQMFNRSFEGRSPVGIDDAWAALDEDLARLGATYKEEKT